MQNDDFSDDLQTCQWLTTQNKDLPVTYHAECGLANDTELWFSMTYKDLPHRTMTCRWLTTEHEDLLGSSFSRDLAAGADTITGRCLELREVMSLRHTAHLHPTLRAPATQSLRQASHKTTTPPDSNRLLTHSWHTLNRLQKTPKDSNRLRKRRNPQKKCRFWLSSGKISDSYQFSDSLTDDRSIRWQIFTNHSDSNISKLISWYTRIYSREVL